MDIYNVSSTLPATALICFTGSPLRVVFLPGESLFRFGSIVSPTFRGNDIFGSPWWIPAATYRQITKRAHHTGQSIANVARSGLSIQTAWNPQMDWLTVFELTKSVYGWVGPAKPQPHSAANRAVMLIGNLDQAYVPGLAPPEAIESDAGRLAYFGSGWADM